MSRQALKSLSYQGIKSTSPTEHMLMGQYEPHSFLCNLSIGSFHNVGHNSVSQTPSAHTHSPSTWTHHWNTQYGGVVITLWLSRELTLYDVRKNVVSFVVHKERWSINSICACAHRIPSHRIISTQLWHTEAYSWGCCISVVSAFWVRQYVSRRHVVI